MTGHGADGATTGHGADGATTGHGADGATTGHGTDGAGEPAQIDYPAWLPAPRPPSPPASGQRLRLRGEETIARLIEAGRDAFAQFGYSAARVDDIVELAGTSHGTFYLYFRNKVDLLRRLAVECETELGALSRELRRLPADLPLDGFEDWLAGLFTAYRRHAPVIRVWLERREPDPVMQALANEALGGLASALQEHLDPDVANLLDPALTTLALLMLILRMAAYVVSNGELSERRAVHTTAALAHAVLARHPAAGSGQ